MKRPSIFFTLALLALAAGCVTGKKPEPGSVPTAREFSDRIKEAADPRKYWIKVYRDQEGPKFVDANRVHLNQFEEIDSVAGRKTDAPMLDVMARRNGQFPALIDTLSEKNWIDFYHAAEQGVIPIGPEPFYIQPKHVKDPIESFVGLLPKLRVGDLHMESVIMNVRAQNRTLGPLARGIDSPEPIAVLGHDFLKPFAFVQFDFPEEIIRLDTTTPYQPSRPNVLAELDLAYGAHGVTVKGVLEHYRGDIAIDVCGNYQLAIPYPESPVETQLILGDFVQRKIPVTDSVALGFYANSIPSIGNELLKDLIVTIDNRRKKVYFEIP